jgi:hypothetical protein
MFFNVFLTQLCKAHHHLNLYMFIMLRINNKKAASD